METFQINCFVRLAKINVFVLSFNFSDGKCVLVDACGSGVLTFEARLMGLSFNRIHTVLLGPRNLIILNPPKVKLNSELFTLAAVPEYWE
mgnify:CR=1 FL=1